MQVHSPPGTMRLTSFGAQAFAARNLELLAAIENTLDALTADTRLLNALHEGYQEIQDKLADHQTRVDPDGRMGAVLEKTADTCGRIYRDAQKRHESARTDPQLQPDDGVTDAYSEFMEALRTLHATVEELREWIATHDAVLEPTTGAVYSNVDDLFAALLPNQ